jgi:hypothetical protein
LEASISIVPSDRWKHTDMEVSNIYVTNTMTDIAEIQLEIKAVEFALRCFARFSDEQQRKDHLRSQFDNVQNLDIYFGFSEFELIDALNKLQYRKKLLLEKKNLLLALQQGGVFTVFVSV